MVSLGRLIGTAFGPPIHRIIQEHRNPRGLIRNPSGLAFAFRVPFALCAVLAFVGSSATRDKRQDQPQVRPRH